MLEPSGFREITRSATTSYPIPFVFCACLAFAIIALGGAALSDGLLRWILVTFAGAFAVYALVLMTWAVAPRNRELLRSEKHQIVNRMLDLHSIGDSETKLETVAEIGRLFSEESRSKQSGPDQRSLGDDR